MEMPEGTQNSSYKKNNFYRDIEVLNYPPAKTTFQPASIRYNVIKFEQNDLFQKWQYYVENHPEAHVFNHPLWFRALEHEYNRKGCVLASLDNHNNIEGILPLLPTLGLPLKLGDLVTTRRYSSLPRSPLGGLLADDEFVREALLDEAIKRVDSKGKTFLQLKCYSSDINLRNRQLHKVQWRSSYFCELPDDPSKISFGNKKQRHRVKWAVNKAKKLGVTVREAAIEEDIKKWYDLYLKTMRCHFVAVRPFCFFKYLWENLSPKGLLTVLLAEIDKGNGKKIISGSFFLHFNKTFFYSFNGRSREGLESHANDLIQWEAIHLATKMGYNNYDMGEVSSISSSLTHFKTKWGCCAKPIYHYYYPLDEKMKEKAIDISEDVNLRKLIWRKVPLHITMQWGILTNRFL